MFKSHFTFPISHFYANEINLHVSEISVSYERMGAKLALRKLRQFGNGVYQSYICAQPLFGSSWLV